MKTRGRIERSRPAEVSPPPLAQMTKAVPAKVHQARVARATALLQAEIAQALEDAQVSSLPAPTV